MPDKLTNYPKFLLVVLLLVTASPSAWFSAPALVRIDLTRGAEIAELDSLLTLVYERVQKGQHDFVLAAVTPSQQYKLQQANLPAKVLALNTSNQEFYWLHPTPSMDIPAILETQAFTTDGLGILVALTQAEALMWAREGLSLRLLLPTYTPFANSLTSNTSYTYQPIDGPSPLVQDMISQVDQSTVYTYTGDLSGEWPADIGGNPYTIATRFSYSGEPIQKASEYLYEFYEHLGLDTTYHQFEADGGTLQNVVAEKKGRIFPQRVFLITSHYDDLPDGSVAPGADDNASGTVAVMLAAEILNEYDFGCTLRFVNFAAEEQGLVGSHYYADQLYEANEDVHAVLNLDMIAWNSAESSPDMDLHTSSGVSGSVDIAYLYQDVVETYGLNLEPSIVIDGSTASDHYWFWAYNIPAIMSTEDSDDYNPLYHTTSDRLIQFEDMGYFAEMVKAGVATFAHLGCLVEDRLATISSLNPSSAMAGDPAFTLTVSGTNFIDGVSTVQWNGYDRTTMFISTTELKAEISAADIATGDTINVTVFNSGPGGGTSNILTFSIDPFPNTDLSVTITDGVEEVNAGSVTTYTIKVANVGPDPVSGATISVTVPLIVTEVTWDCEALIGSSCTSSGLGNFLSDSVDLASGGSVIYIISGTISETALGQLDVSTTVAVPDGITDPDTGNNSATDITTILQPIPITGQIIFLPVIVR